MYWVLGTGSVLSSGNVPASGSATGTGSVLGTGPGKEWKIIIRTSARFISELDAGR